MLDLITVFVEKCNAILSIMVWSFLKIFMPYKKLHDAETDMLMGAGALFLPLVGGGG